MSKKESKFHRYLEWVKGKRQAEAGGIKIEGISEAAFKIVQDKRLTERKDEYLKLLEILHEPIDKETLNSYIDDLESMVKMTHVCVCNVGGVYARSGDSHKFAKMMWGWDGLYGLNLGDCIKVRKYWGNDDPLEVEKKDGNGKKQNISINIDHVHHLHLALINHYFTKAFNVLNYCFKDIDVRAQSITVIQSMMPLMEGGGGETMTGSMGRTSEELMWKPKIQPHKRGVPNEA